MNYIRGAVNAISAPYQYYKDLPPINPSTLTGAIDVIVIQRPTDGGGTELVCSPFHVRFGKWQVLRPGEKKVNVFVNGNPIPFNMKIGEAGEAFFVFETDDDVPADLITSPILQPTIPGKDSQEQNEGAPVDTDRFGTKADDDKKEQQVTEHELSSNAERARTEPDFLDLDANANEEAPPTPKQQYNVPQALRKSGSRATINQSSLSSASSPRDLSIEREHTPEISEQDQRVDEALESLRSRTHVPEVDYHRDVTLDIKGYKSGYHGRESSSQTVRSQPRQFQFPRKEVPGPETSPTIPNTQSSPAFSTSISPSQSPSTSRSPSPSPSPSPSGSGSMSPAFSAHPYAFRATSEPPPDLDSDPDASQIHALPLQPHNADVLMPLQVPVEYSWEWGAFPQPSPMKASFGKGGRIEPPQGIYSTKTSSRLSERKGRVAGMRLPVDANISNTLAEGLVEEPYEHAKSNMAGRSRSVPPHFLANPPRKARRHSREYKEYEDAETEEEEEDEEEERGRGRSWNEVSNGIAEITPQEVDSEAFGAGGLLSASRDDLTTFVLSIEGRKLSFQLSLVPPEGEEVIEEQRDVQKKPISVSEADKERDEIEATRLFDNYCIDWGRFLDDNMVVYDPRLVIRWSGNQYITRNDGSPLMEALVRWRSTTLAKRASGDMLRPISPPPPEGEYADNTGHKIHERSKSDGAHLVAEKKGAPSKEGQEQGAAKKPASSSWSAWWSRSRRKDTMNENTAKLPPYDSSVDQSSISLPLPQGHQSFLNGKTKGASAADVNVPTTPPQRPVDPVAPSPSQAGLDTTPTRPAHPKPAKKFAKTLRLTSDQLKSLNLRPGRNSITFSLSASGAIAATARIFVWEYTDLVVISDIDGTITKSDGLGHVFAMIGRDWTHLGVAKLYTDIVKNGYKIMYLTSRAIGQADATRDYLKGIKQNNYQLPEGPVIMSPDRLMASLHREVIMRKPEVFKMACLRDIQRLFGESARNPFYAGFGNRITDALSYRSVNVPSARIFTIDSSGEVKMELLELAGYKSSYIHMTDLVDQMFPPINRKWTPEFTDFNYWKAPIQDFPLPDFSPPSPALSARSDTSNQSTLARLRNFSLGGNASTPIRHSASRQSTITLTNDDQGADGSPYRNSHLRQMSSFEKLSSTLGFMSKFNTENERQRSTSPSSSSSYVSDDEDDDIDIGVDGRRRRTRRRSMTSMPGTLEEQHFEFDDDDDRDDDRQFVHSDDDGEDGYQGEDHDEVEANVEEFDDDILAAGEMANVPFL